MGHLGEVARSQVAEVAGHGAGVQQGAHAAVFVQLALKGFDGGDVVAGVDVGRKLPVELGFLLREGCGRAGGGVGNLALRPVLVGDVVRLWHLFS